MMLAAGTHLGPYEIVAPLGAGGMGEVYRARDRKLGRDVAIKILPGLFPGDEWSSPGRGPTISPSKDERLERFEREAQLLAALNHPNIAAIYGWAEEGSLRGLVLELVEGSTLAERLAVGGALTIPEALAIAQQMATALEAAHEKGIVHRDLKPANVKVTPSGTVKVLDFGLAKLVQPPDASADAADPARVANQATTTSPAVTRHGVILGTAAYMSPEQARGKPVDKRADVWSFGCVMFELLTGRVAFRGETVSDTIAALLTTEPDWSALPPGTPPLVRRLLQRCLQKNPAQRLRDMGDARFDIDEAISGVLAAPPGTTIPSPPPPKAQAPPVRTSRLPWSVAAALALALGTLLWTRGAGTWSRNHEAPSFSRAIRLTSSPGQEFGPAISPDGKWVAYYSNPGGRSDVWVRFLENGSTLNLTAGFDREIAAIPGASGLEISPDGTLIAFNARQDPATATWDTWVIPAPLGGPPRKLLSSLLAMRWSPDGSRIVAMRAGSTRGDTLVLADGDGTNERELVPPRGGRHLHWPAWSRDGEFIYFIQTYQSWNIEPSEIARVPVTGGEPEVVVHSARRAIYPVPMADSEGLIYAGNPGGVELGLWWVRPGRGEARPLTLGVGEHAESRVSLDGRKVVTALIDMRESLVRLPVRPGDTVPLEPITDGYTGDLDPSFDSTGQRMVFSSSRGGNRNLWLARPDATQASPLTTGTAIDERPAFSPDGRQIAFVSDRDGRRGIWIVSADGGAPRLVGRASPLDVLTWSRDGTRLLFATAGTDMPQLGSISLADGKEQRWPTPGGAFAPAWSPTGDVIAYLTPVENLVERAWPPQIAFVDGGGQPLSLLPAQGVPAFLNGFMAWSPDGRRLAAVSIPMMMGATIWIVEPGGARPFQKLIELPADVRPRGIAWTRDGAALVISCYRWTSDIVLFESAR